MKNEKIENDFNNCFGIAFDIDRVYVAQRLDYLESPYNLVKLAHEGEAQGSFPAVLEMIEEIDRHAFIFIAGEVSKNVDWFRSSRGRVKKTQTLRLPASFTQLVPFSTQESKLIASWRAGKGEQFGIDRYFDQYEPEIESHFNDIDKTESFFVRGAIHPAFKAMLASLSDCSWTEDETMSNTIREAIRKGCLARQGMKSRSGRPVVGYDVLQAMRASDFNVPGIMRRI
ncbi:MAG: hypothetical protein HOC09_03395 [Deltaproteobacteria bacterium]|jgi:hypothetical protein|nr:hypothetical protein [Deltaproteobacteria bacterium]